MVRSMTGFGDAAREEEGFSCAVEIRGLNNRYFKPVVRVPEEASGLEPEVEAVLRQRVGRGTVTATVHLQEKGKDAAYQLNSGAIQQYLDYLRDVADQASERTGGRVGLTVDLGSIMTLPGVIQPPDEASLVHRVRETVVQLAEEACDKLVAMREREGKQLLEDLLTQRRRIGEWVERIAEVAPRVVQDYEQRLRARVDQLLSHAEVDAAEVDLAKEVAVYGERADISEEIQRIRTHLQHLEQILHQSDPTPAGRTVDFIAQELLREANTIGSKSNDPTINRTIVEVKRAIDRIKEQAQNIE